MIIRIMSKKDVIEQLESLKSSTEYKANKKDNNEMLVKDVVALEVAIASIKKKRIEDIYIVIASMSLMFAILSLILFAWNMA